MSTRTLATFLGYGLLVALASLAIGATWGVIPQLVFLIPVLLASIPLGSWLASRDMDRRG